MKESLFPTYFVNNISDQSFMREVACVLLQILIAR